MNNTHFITERDMNTAALSVSAFKPALTKNANWLLVFGVSFTLLGFIGMGAGLLFTLTSVMLFGCLLSIAGGIQLINTPWQSGVKEFSGPALLALSYIVAGSLTLIHPLQTSVALTAFIGAGIIAVGAARILLSFKLNQGRGWMLFSGLTSLILGALILTEWSESSVWVIGLLIAIELFFQGWALIMLALTMKKMAQASTL